MSKNNLHSEELIAQVEARMAEDPKLSLGELSKLIGVSKTSLSYWLRRNYPSDPSRLEAKIKLWLDALFLTRRDERLLMSIQDKLDEADSKKAVVANFIIKNSAALGATDNEAD